MSLHGDIMNIQIGGVGVSIATEALTESGEVTLAYKLGHRDARHAAADMAIKHDSAIEFLLRKLEELSGDLDRFESPEEEFYCRRSDAEDAIEEFHKQYGEK